MAQLPITHTLNFISRVTVCIELLLHEVESHDIIPDSTNQ